MSMRSGSGKGKLMTLFVMSLRLIMMISGLRKCYLKSVYLSASQWRVIYGTRLTSLLGPSAVTVTV